MKKGLSCLYSLSLLAMLFFVSDLRAQQWTFAGGYGTNTGFAEAGQAVATDAAGNVYLTGKFNTSINFGNGTATLTANTTGTKTDGFVAKFNSSGLCQWSIRFGGPGTDLGGLGIATDGVSVFVTGNSAFPCTVGSAAAIAAVGGSTDGVVFSLNAATGVTNWVKAFGGAPAGDRGQAATVDASGNLYISGLFFTRSTDANQASFGTAGAFTRSVQGNMAQSTSDLFVAQISGATGSFNWVSTGGAVASASPLTIANDNNTGSGISYIAGLNEVVLTGSFTNANAVYSTASPVSSVALTNMGQSDICLLELNAANGAFISGAAAGGTTNDEGLGTATDGTNIFLTGYFNSSVIGGAFALINSGAGFDEIFYAKYDPVTNTFPWSKSAGGSNADVGFGTAVGSSGNVFVTGRYQSTVSFPTGGAPLTSTTAGADDVFLVKLDASNGNAVLLAKGAGATGADASFGIASATGDHSWIGGSFFGGNFTLTPSSPTITITSTGDDDVYLAKFSDMAVAVPTVFYSKSSGNLHDLATWGDKPDGSGVTPSDFGAGKTFNLANRAGVYTMTADWTVAGIIVNPSGSQLQINGFSLSEAGMTGTGTITGSPSSSLVITGTTGGEAGPLAFTAGGRTLNHLLLNRTGPGAMATLITPLEIYGTLGSNNGILNTGGTLTLNSDATSTARVLPLPTLTSISGNLTVERYIPARRAWRILSSPIYGGVTINQAWQEGKTNVQPNPNPFPGFGTHITGGPVFGTAANGFDQNPGSSSSIKFYNSATDSWNNLPNTNVNPVGLQAYMVFIRGDRGIALGPDNVPPVPTTLRATGPMWIGDITYNVNATGFTALANPYASPINFATLPKNNVQQSVWLWDPKMGGVNGVGAYVNVSFNGTTWDVTPASVSPESQFIQSGQGFLVKTINPAISGQVVVREADKSATPSTDVFRMARNSSIRISLASVNPDQSSTILDEVFSSYKNDFSETIDRMDAVKLENMQENLAIVHGQDLLMVERRPALSEEDMIDLKIWNTGKKNYQFEIKPENLPAGLSAWLVDKYLQTVTSVPLDRISKFQFQVSEIEASAKSDRFQLVISKTKPGIEALLTENSIRAYPNPVAGKTINLQFNKQPKGNYQIVLVNSIGQVIQRMDFSHEGGSVIKQLELEKTLSKGIYRIQIKGPEQSLSIPLIQQ